MHVALAGSREYIGNYTHLVYAMLLHLRCEVVEAFKVFKAMAENASSKRVKVIGRG